MKHSDYITHIKNEEDFVYLKREHFPVNMRLFKTSKEYKNIILQCCEYIKMLATTKAEGYKKPHGMSSANAGLSFNIIGIVMNRNTEKEFCKIMINPIIKAQSREKVNTQSNCGSITLEEPITIVRSVSVWVSYFDEKGKKHFESFNREQGCFTIQHEVEHNLGILITDKI